MKQPKQNNDKKRLLHINKATDPTITAGVNINLPDQFFLKLGLAIAVPALFIVLMLIIRDYLKK